MPKRAQGDGDAEQPVSRKRNQRLRIAPASPTGNDSPVPPAVSRRGPPTADALQGLSGGGSGISHEAMVNATMTLTTANQNGLPSIVEKITAPSGKLELQVMNDKRKWESFPAHIELDLERPRVPRAMKQMLDQLRVPVQGVAPGYKTIKVRSQMAKFEYEGTAVILVRIPPDGQPVYLCCNVLSSGVGMPRKTLFISPEHAMLLKNPSMAQCFPSPLPGVLSINNAKASGQTQQLRPTQSSLKGAGTDNPNADSVLETPLVVVARHAGSTHTGPLQTGLTYGGSSYQNTLQNTNRFPTAFAFQSTTAPLWPEHFPGPVTGLENDLSVNRELAARSHDSLNMPSDSFGSFNRAMVQSDPDTLSTTPYMQSDPEVDPGLGNPNFDANYDMYGPYQ